MKNVWFAFIFSLTLTGAFAQSALRVTEVMSAGNTPDWFELTNVSSNPINVTGYKVDDGSFNYANALPLNGVTMIAPGERVIFVESASNYSNAFYNVWGVNNLQVGHYSGLSIGLNSSGDGVIIFDAGGVEVTRVSFGTATPGKSFYWGYNDQGQFDPNHVGINNVGLVSTLGNNSGQLGILSIDGANQLASPGTSLVTCTSTIAFYEDADSDGYGNENVSINACVAPNGYTSNGGDCNDIEYNVSPIAVEICNEIDDNCDGEADEYVMLSFYLDADIDGFGNLNEMVLTCDQPAGYVSNSEDCDDSVLLFEDVDLDGFGSNVLEGCGVEMSGDCDDFNSNVNITQSEICNEVDDNCDGAVDEGVQLMYYLDSDLDGYGDANTSVMACAVIEGLSENNMDCDDFHFEVNPTAAEVCNEVDDNCNQEVDEFVLSTFYLDADGDGFGDANNVISSCQVQLGYVDNGDDCDDALLTYEDLDGDGYAGETFGACGEINATDCDDYNTSSYPGAVELCDALDNNCNGEVDELYNQNVFYADNDGDGFGDLNNPVFACVQPNGSVTNAEDCDDSAVTYEDLDGDGFGSDILVSCGVLLGNDCDDFDNQIYPSAQESCNGIDDNCNVEVDEFVLLTFFFDGDGDGFGDPNLVDYGCELPLGYVLNDSDCDDTVVLFLDMDGDGFGSTVMDACGSDNSDDCLDSDAQINPSALEVCDGSDQNCNGQVDEDVASVFYADFDLDGFGDLNNSVFGCDAPLGFVDNALDCDDAVVLYADLDGDGFGSIDLDACGVNNSLDCNDFELLFEDLDADGFGSEVLASCGVDNALDCDDQSISINPSGAEVCNGLDDNCNVEVDEGVLSVYYADLDGDGFGNQNEVAFACEIPVGFIDNADDCDDTMLLYLDLDSDGQGGEVMSACGISSTGDCDDSNAMINSAALDICNGLDDNCNQEVDENGGVEYFADLDGDGFGNINASVVSCFPISGYVTNSFDCDDNLILYQDLDSDGFGGQVMDACGVSNNLDCIDFDDTVNPSAVEVCDNVDQNCNGLVDEGLLLTFYADIDGDGYGNSDVSLDLCEVTAGYVADSTDCNDEVSTVNPGAIEIFDNAIDENCDGLIEVGVGEHTVGYLNLYPNPAQDYVTVIANQKSLGEVAVYNANGTMVNHFVSNSNQINIDVRLFESGIYYIKFQDQVKMFVVSH